MNDAKIKKKNIFFGGGPMRKRRRCRMDPDAEQKTVTPWAAVPRRRGKLSPGLVHTGRARAFSFTAGRKQTRRRRLHFLPIKGSP